MAFSIDRLFHPTFQWTGSELVTRFPRSISVWALAFALEVSQNFFYFISIVIVMDGRLLVVYIYLVCLLTIKCKYRRETL